VAVKASLQLSESSPSSGAAMQQNAGPAKAYVGLFKDNAVAVVDLESDQGVRTISVPPGPHGLVATPDGRKVFVSSDGASTVSVIDTATDRVLDSIEVGPTPHGLAISDDGRLILVSGFGVDQALVVDSRTDQVVGRVPVPQPHNSAISPDGRWAYVGSQKQGDTALVAIDLTTMTRAATIPLDKTPRALGFSPDGRSVYFTLAGSDAVQVLDVERGVIATQIPVGASPHLATFTPDGQLGLTVAQGPGELDLIDRRDNAESAAIPVGKAPHWLATSPDGRTAYVTNESSNDLSIVDLASRQVLATVPVGNAPRKIAVVSGPVAGQAMATADGPAVDGMAGHHMDAATVESMQKSTGMAVADSQVSPQPAGARAVQFNDHGAADAAGLTELDIEADDNYFSPTFLRGAPGQRLKLVVQNESSSLHNFSIPELGIATNIAPHATAEIEVTFPQSGSTRFTCKFHTALGMNGALLVGDAAP
jgi:YVTN family beta-propeller protein